jgi:anti-sigma-K factor RskA
VSHDLLAAYALDAVDDAERADVDRHLAGCAECARELAELRETLGVFALSGIAAEAPPPQLRTRLLETIGRTPQRAGVLRSPLPLRRLRLVPVLATVVILALLGVLVGQQVRLAGERQRADQIAAVLAAPDAQLVTVAANGGGDVSIVVSRQLSQGVVTLRGLPSGDDRHAYQLWLVHDGRPDSAGLLDPGDGDGVRLVDDVGAATLLGVTREPAGGSATPTPPMVAALPL